MKFDKIVPYDFSVNTGKVYIIFINVENAYNEYHLSIIRPGHNDPNLGVHGWQISENLFSVKSVKENNMLKILLGPDIVCHMSSGSNYEILIGTDKQNMSSHHISWKGVPSIRKPSIPSTNGIELQLINEEISITEDYAEKIITKTENIKIKENIISNISQPIENKMDMPLSSIDKLKLEVSMKVFDNYCNINTFDNLVQFGITNCGLDQTETQIILKMEFENKKITNEKKLVTEMESLLHQFTDKDKKLDDKEKDDTIQLFCKARPGYQQGLNFEFANNYIITFCRKNSVKIKVRFLKWEVPLKYINQHLCQNVKNRSLKNKIREVIMNQIDQTWLENRIRASISDDFYLDREEEKQIKQEGTNRGIGINDIELILQVELDKLGAVSERILTNELDQLLHQFTDNDEVLDRKEERDALNKVCSPAHGKKIGLDYKVAEDYVKNFCKVNGVTRHTDSKKWVKPLIIVLSILLLILSVLVFIFITKEPVIERVVETKIERVVETKMVEANAVVLNDNDKIQIDDLMRRTQQYIEKSQFTDPPEKSAKSTLDEIKQIDPSGQYRGDEIKLLLSKIVDHYIELAKKSASVGDLPKASKWLDRAKLLNTDREIISDEEKALGLTANNEAN